MQDYPEPCCEVARIRCVIHHRLSSRIAACLTAMGIAPIFIESGRNVRRHVRKRYFGLPGFKRRLHDTPVEFIYATVARDRARTALAALIDAAELHVPGRGSVYAEDIVEYRGKASPAASDTPAEGPGRPSEGKASPALPRDLACITAILSMPGSAEQCARMALELGTCVPLVTLGEGTGMRDRLGLLRITIPPEKEVVRLLVPEHDSGSIMRLLIEGMRLDRPGSGYIYCTPVKAGILDTRQTMGFQDSAASMEQIIAAIDQLKTGTAWRRRFADIESGASDGNRPFMFDQMELTVNCLEGGLSTMVMAAMDAGAGGATTFRLRRFLTSENETADAARESATINVSRSMGACVIRAMLGTGVLDDDPSGRIQSLEVPMAFNHRG